MKVSLPLVGFLAHVGVALAYRPPIRLSSPRSGLSVRWMGKGATDTTERKGKEKVDVAVGWSSLLFAPVFRRFTQSSSKLMDAGLGPSTALATLATVWWVWSTVVVNSLDFQARVSASGIKKSHLPGAKIGKGDPYFVEGRDPVVDPSALRADVGSSYNPTLIIYGDRGAGKTVGLRLALEGEEGVVYTKFGPSDLDNAPRALARAVVEVSGASVPQGTTSTTVAETALRRVKEGGGVAPILLLDLDERCSQGQLQNVLLACKHWGDEEKLAKFVVEVQSCQPIMGLSAYMGDMRAEGIKVPGLTQAEAWKLAQGLIPQAATREQAGSTHEDLTEYVATRVGGAGGAGTLLDIVRVGRAFSGAEDPEAFRAAVDSFTDREARAARTGSVAFLSALGASCGGGEEGGKRRRVLSTASAPTPVTGGVGEAAGEEGGVARLSLDEVCEAMGVTVEELAHAMEEAEPTCPVSVDPFLGTFAVKEGVYRDALIHAIQGEEEAEEKAAKAKEQEERERYEKEEREREEGEAKGGGGEQ
ncbi:unnamed protein product [Discosporangium mesarthrocarpum]